MILIIIFFIISCYLIYHIVKIRVKNLSYGDKVLLKVSKIYFKENKIHRILYITINSLIAFMLYPQAYLINFFISRKKKFKTFFQISAYSFTYSIKIWVLLSVWIFSIILLPLFNYYGFNNLYAKFIAYYLIILSLLSLLLILIEPLDTKKTWTTSIFNEKLLLIVSTISLAGISTIGYVYLFMAQKPLVISVREAFNLFFRFENVFDFIVNRDSLLELKFNIKTIIYIHGILFYSIFFIYLIRVFKFKKDHNDHLIISLNLIIINRYSFVQSYIKKNRRNLKSHYYYINSILQLILDRPNEAINSLKKFVNNNEEDIIDVIYLCLLNFCFVLHTPDKIDLHLLSLAKKAELKSYTYGVIRKEIKKTKYNDMIDFENCASKSKDSISYSKLVDAYEAIEDNKDAPKNKFYTIANMKSDSFNLNCIKFYYLFEHGVYDKEKLENYDTSKGAFSPVIKELKNTLLYFKSHFHQQTLIHSNYYFYKHFVLVYKTECNNYFSELYDLFWELESEFIELRNLNNLGQFDYLIDSEKYLDELHKQS